MTVGDAQALDSRRNNFTLVRLILASSVIYTHCYWLVTGREGADDLSWLIGAPVSAYAVDGFFFLSGFLVYPSLLRLGRPLPFLGARIVRLWPALAVAVALTVLGGALVTGAVLPSYLGGDTAKFVAFNLSLMAPAYHLTGVSCDEGPCNINGSLWTLPWEARCYILLALLASLGLARPTMMRRIVLPATLAGSLIWHVPAVPELVRALAGDGAVYLIGMFDRLWAAFALGIAAYLFRDRITLSWLVLLLLFGLTVAAHALGGGLHMRAILIGYAILCFGLLSARWKAVPADSPDYSYGMYIYAFPVMLVVNALIPGLSYGALALVNLLATLPFAILSWHIVEQPLLKAYRSRHRHVPPASLLQT